MLFDGANSHSALRTWSAFVDVNDVILKAWRHLLEDIKDWDRSFNTFFFSCVVSCNIWALWEQSTSPIKLIHTRHTPARQGVVWFSDLHWRFRGIQGCEMWEKWFPPPHTHTDRVKESELRISRELQRTMFGTIWPFFFTTQIRIKTTKRNSFPLSNPYFMIIPHSKTLGKMELSKESCCSIFLPLAPLLETNKQTPVSTFH